jgi:hypothetical protein
VDIDEVRFVCSRSFHDEIEIVVKRPSWEPSGAPMLIATIYPVPRWRGEKREPIELKKKISEEIFAELRNYVTRQDLIEHSLTESPISTDGSMWLLEGRKGDFVIQHRRLNPVDAPDTAFVAIGKRFLGLADISIPKKELY